MNFDQLIRERISIRGYKTDPVPRSIIEEIIETTKWALSSMNTQPWYVNVLTGDPLDKVREGNTQNMLSGYRLNATSP